MRKWRISVCLACLLCLLAACGQPEPAGTDWTTQQMAWAILASQGEVPEMNAPDSGEAFAAYIAGYYQLDPQWVEAGAVFYAGGVSALEVAVLRLSESAKADKVEQALWDYIDTRTGAFTGYAPEEAAILEQSSAVARGRYAALLVCPDQQAALEAFDACFAGGIPSAVAPWSSGEDAAPEAEGVDTPEEEPESVQPDGLEPPAETEPETEEETPPEQPAEPEEAPAPALDETPSPAPEQPAPEEPWSYDEARLLAAWEAGSWSELAERDREILDKCKEVIDAWAGPELTDYQRELGIHDWMIAWAEYDRDSLDHSSGDRTDPDSETPYGLLIRQTGICRGYASTFQLLMKLIGLECVTVEGTSHGGTDEHAWNMVKLDGEWYCVDVTWDDPIAAFPVSETVAHRYFNVTSEFLRQCDHQWDQAQAVEATGTAYAWVKP